MSEWVGEIGGRGGGWLPEFWVLVEGCDVLCSTLGGEAFEVDEMLDLELRLRVSEVRTGERRETVVQFRERRRGSRPRCHPRKR